MTEVAAVTNQLTRVVKKNLPTVLAGCATGSLLGAVYTAVKATFKAGQLIREEEERREETLPEYENKELTTQDKAMLVWKEYIPTFLFTTSACVFIWAGEKTGRERYIALMSAYKLSRQALDERKEAESDVLAESDRKLVDERARVLRADSVVIPKDDIPHVTKDGDETLYIESITKTPFYAKENDVLHAFNVMNHKLNIEDRASVSDILDDLELRTSRASDIWEWGHGYGCGMGSVVEPFFHHTFLDGDPSLPATLIEYSVDPEPTL